MKILKLPNNQQGQEIVDNGSRLQMKKGKNRNKVPILKEKEGEIFLKS